MSSMVGLETPFTCFNRLLICAQVLLFLPFPKALIINSISITQNPYYQFLKLLTCKQDKIFHQAGNSLLCFYSDSLVSYYLYIMSIFKRLIANRRQQQHEEAIESIMVYLLDKAAKISERAVQFVKKLKDKHDISERLFLPWQYDIKNPNISPICSKIIKQTTNSATFRCYDCIESISSCICAECFANGNHKGHKYIQYQSTNGCCDCGNQQSWNQKGFCKNHGRIHQLKCQIDPVVEKQYLQEFGLAFYIYFYLIQYKKADSYKQLYGNALFSYLTNISRSNYQMKFLAYKLLSNTLPNTYKDSDIDIQSTVLHRIFKVKKTEELNKFVELTFEVFPVEQFRILMLQEYFDKTKKKGEVFTSDHPLAILNFQYLSCVKLINKLMKKNLLQPLSIYRYKYLGHSIDLPSAFKKYYEDLDYINNMKSAKQYHILHLRLSNICDMCFYRQFTTAVKRLDQKDIIEYNLDELFLKTLCQFVKDIKDQKQLMEKCLRELMQYISEAQVSVISLAHERAFALITYAYFNGNIYKLHENTISRQFIDIVFQGQLDISVIFQQFLTKCLKSKLNYAKNSKIQAQLNDYESYFLKIHPEQNIPQYLDILFHKIMIIICRSYIDYSLIVADTLETLKQNINLIDEYFSFENQRQSQNEQIKVEIYNQNYSLFYSFLNFINSIRSVKIDELVIGNCIQLVQFQQINNLYKRLLSTFRNLNSTEFKNLAFSIIHNQQLLESFISQYCKVQNGKIRCNSQGQPLQTYIFMQFFNKYEKNLKQFEPSFFKKSVILPQFNNYTIINQETVGKIMEIIMNFLFNFTSLNSSKSFSELFSLICFEYLKIYLQNCTVKEKSFFQTLLQPSFRPLISKQLLEQIILLQKQAYQVEKERQRIKDQKSLQDNKKREKMLAKKKLKQLGMKQKQQNILNTYKTQLIQNGGLQCLNDCIYCKSPKDEQLNLISYIGLTNFYEKRFMNDNDYHIYFESCGHKVHRSCYDLVLMKSKSNYCFLCKREANILVPQYSQMKEQADSSRSADVIFSFQAVLINQRQQMKNQFHQEDKFLVQQQVNFYELLIKGICRDIFFIGLRNNERYRKTKALLHYQLLLIIKSQSNDEIQDIFKNIKVKQTQNYYQIFNYIQYKIEELMFQINNNIQQYEQQFSLITSDQIMIINTFFNSVFKLNNQSSTIQNLNIIIQKQLFNEIPQILCHMSQYYGECKICENVTNYIYVCIKCGWNSCNKCLKIMQKHATYTHLDGTIFISCTNGAVKYLHAGTIFEDGSIYENYLKQSYTQINSYSQLLKIDKFKINRNKLEKIHNMALQYEIHQKIFLNDH